MTRLERKWVGKKVRLSKWTMGVHKGKEGIVIPASDVPTDHRGTPKISGHYKPMDKDELAIKDKDGNLFTAFASDLEEA